MFEEACCSLALDAVPSLQSRVSTDYRLENYEGAKHSFTNPDADKYGKQFGLPLAYDAAADKASWEAMKQMFRDVFGH